MALDRRALLRAGALLGGAMALQACAGSRVAKDFPKPVWPDQAPPPSSSTLASMGTQWVPPAAQPVAASMPTSAPSTSVQGVIPRTQWVREQPRWRVSKAMNGVRMITVHHDALNTDGQRGWGFAVSRLTKIRRDHLSRGSQWVDIGYHYIVDPDGRVWEGRPASIEGAHVSATNEHNLGIMCMGNFEQQRPTQAQLDTLDGFVAAMMRQHQVPVSRVYTHQELKPTECPGRNLQAYMRQTRTSRGRMTRLA